MHLVSLPPCRAFKSLNARLAVDYPLHIHCMCVSLYIHNKYIQYTHIDYINKNFILDAIIHD